MTLDEFAKQKYSSQKVSYQEGVAIFPSDLQKYRDRLLKRSKELRSQGHSRLRGPLLITEKYLKEGISISSVMQIPSRIKASKYLEDCENLIDGIELWSTQDSQPSWVEFRSLFEEFAFQLLELDSLRVILKRKYVKV